MPRKRVKPAPTFTADPEWFADDDTMSPSQRRIAAAAIEAFAMQGFNGTATSDIAKRAGVAEGTIFKYYPTKKKLLIGAVAPLMMRALTPMLRRSVERVLSADYATFEDFVIAFARDRLDFAQAHPALLKLLVQEIPFHPELREHFERIVFAQVFPLALSAIERFQARKQIRAMPPLTVARIMGSVIVGYVVSRVFLAPDAVWDDEREIDTLAGVLARGLRPG
ncbi:MAG TPA: TetR/AcrR family transcriptional regulator [Gemmatimonadaceae bacterium]|nr:TetR/AcrR family transcriptional regulator [Gemmatimonadaceae bacterium]